MARPRKVPDPVVHRVVLDLTRHGGEKAVTFSAVAERAGLAASSLAERYGSIAGLIAEARKGAWAALDAASIQAIAEAPLTPKGAVQLLKALPRDAVPPPGDDPERAMAWRSRVEAALAVRLGRGGDAADAAAVMLAVWQDRVLWGGVAQPRLRLKAVQKLIAG